MRAYLRSWNLLKERKKIQLRCKTSRVRTILRMLQKEKNMDKEGKYYRMFIHQESLQGGETILLISLHKILALKDLEFTLGN